MKVMGFHSAVPRLKPSILRGAPFPLPCSSVDSFSRLSFLQLQPFFFFSFNLFIYIYFWLCWVFVSVRGLSLVVASGGHPSLRCAGLSRCGAQAPDAQAQ